MTPGDSDRPPRERTGPERTDAEQTQAPEGDPAAVGEAEDETGPAGPEPDWVRRRRLDAAFGDGAHSESLGDRWYRDQVPPHHG